MKTTLDLPDELLREAKTTAARRGTTLRSLITHALQRELHHPPPPGDGLFLLDEDGIPHLPGRGASVTSELIRRLMDQQED